MCSVEPCYTEYCPTCQKEVSCVLEGGVSGDGDIKYVLRCPVCGTVLDED